MKVVKDVLMGRGKNLLMYVICIYLFIYMYIRFLVLRKKVYLLNDLIFLVL